MEAQAWLNVSAFRKCLSGPGPPSGGSHDPRSMLDGPSGSLALACSPCLAMPCQDSQVSRRPTDLFCSFPLLAQLIGDFEAVTHPGACACAWKITQNTLPSGAAGRTARGQIRKPRSKAEKPRNYATGEAAR